MPMQKKGLKLPSSLGETIQLVARIGGYLGRKKDPHPGHQIMWQGYADLQLLCAGFLLLEDD